MSSFHRIQDRLEAYRRQKQEEKTEDILEHVPPNVAVEGVSPEGANGDKPRDKQNVTDKPEETIQFGHRAGPFNWLTFSLKLLLWILLFGFFVEIGFGQAFFVSSGIFFMVYFLKGSRRKKGELSAYSVFNKNMERLEGTLSADQFERELRYGPGAVS